MQIYLAGPLFNKAEREYASKIVRDLERNGIEVYWPWRDAGDSRLKRIYKGDMAKVNDEIVRRNLVAIRRSSLIVAVLDGLDVETGTSFEIGYGHALGKRVIGLRTDFRTQGEDIGPVNIMIGRKLHGLMRDERDLLSILRKLERRAFGKKSVGQFYSAVAEEYDDIKLHPITNRLRLLEQSFTRGVLSGKRYGVALDIGCGNGGFLEHVPAERKIGIDISAKMIEEHRKKVQTCTYLVSDAEKGIALPNGSVDIAHSSFLIDHIGNLEKFFSEVNRVLKKKGDLFLLSMHDRKLMLAYRREHSSFTFRTAGGHEYDVYSVIPRYAVLRKAFGRYFGMQSNDVLSIVEGDARVGIDYLVLGAKK